MSNDRSSTYHGLLLLVQSSKLGRQFCCSTAMPGGFLGIVPSCKGIFGDLSGSTSNAAQSRRRRPMSSAVGGFVTLTLLPLGQTPSIYHLRGYEIWVLTMRLLNLTTLELREFFNEEVPPYAILSHRWGRNEVSFKDMRKKRNLEGPGFAKIQSFCKFSRDWRHERRSNSGTRSFTIVEWGWVDTCCIDKSSSAELSEAINSMFAWYRDSEFCCVYLADVPALSAGHVSVWTALERSEWFTRGWTLQELLAPTSVVFCNTKWELLGYKFDLPSPWVPGHGGDFSMSDRISSITGIDKQYLIYHASYKNASIACRMSWAAKRKTTRVEDITYCLLGLFDVHMPPLYGEGEIAFRRLQEEILRRSNDQSIFAWFNLDEHLETYKIDGDWQVLATPILAMHPHDFSGSGRIIASGQAPKWPYSLTNNGLELRALAQQYNFEELSRDIFQVQLNCYGDDWSDGGQTQIFLGDVSLVKQETMRIHLRSSGRTWDQRSFETLRTKGEGEKLFYVKIDGRAEGLYFRWEDVSITLIVSDASSSGPVDKPRDSTLQR